ncbi:MAG TPA: tRNA (adenosine(37)-N6)-dimethylallyltransferase MiaA [Thermomicrobiales bacterium]|nr:tRNA (adenosine(37)-N6)-dimethylallyltransferase MiaA [Thermomicrobiales bacterium]
MTAEDPGGQLIVVTGPTGVGKTAAAIRLAESLGGEIVNADSRYLYRGFDIGVAKPSIGERGQIVHHLIDILPPDGEMSLSIYQRLATDTIRDILGRGRVPLLVGGTVLYVNAVVEGWHIPQVPPDLAFRAEAEARAALDGGESLRAELASIDPVVAERSGRNTRRVIRALEIYRATGVPMSELESRGAPPFRSRIFALTMPREPLHRRLDERVATLVERGLIDEVRGLLASGVPESAAAMGSIGYRQLLPYLRGEASLDDCIRRIEVDTHRYVRHQETWLRRAEGIERLDVTEPGWEQRLEDLARSFLRRGAAGPAYLEAW